MGSFSLSRDLTLILKNAKQGYCRLWGRNALGKLSGVTISTSGSNHPEETVSENARPQSTLALPVEIEDVEVLTSPSPETFFPLPAGEEVAEAPPVGAMFCDVYRREDNRFEKQLTGSDISDPADLPGGITGPGIEFFYPSGREGYRETKWDLSVPIFRDPLTPTYPKQTVRSLFEYGREESPRSTSTQQPTLRSAI